MSFASVARQVIHQQIRPSLLESRSTTATPQPPNMQALMRSLMPRGAQKDWLRICVELIMSAILLAVSAVHIFHGALLFHGIVVNVKVQPGRVCASSSFLIDSSAIGIIDPRFCPNLQLAQPTISCSSLGSTVTDAQVSALFGIPSKMFFFAQDCASANNSYSPQCKALLASSLSMNSSAGLESQSQSQSSALIFKQLSKFCSASLAHLQTSTKDASIEITSMTSLSPSFSRPSTLFSFCSCDAAWAIITLDSRGAATSTAAKFLLQEPPNDASAVEILAGPEAAALNCDSVLLGPACAFSTAVRTPLGNGCACLQWIHFESKLWWMLILLQMTAATAVWLREGAALLLPLLAYRNVAAARSLSFSLPCAIAITVWSPRVIAESPAASSRASAGDFKRRWLLHFLTFTVAQHSPMFVGSFFFSRVVSMSDDPFLKSQYSDLATQSAIAGLGTR